MDISVHTIGNAISSLGRCSDHVPVAAFLRTRQKRPSSFGRPVAPWICKHPASHSYLTTFSLMSDFLTVNGLL
eukprot:2609762-Heterocapsa_arctica.AAC.1